MITSAASINTIGERGAHHFPTARFVKAAAHTRENAKDFPRDFNRAFRESCGFKRMRSGRCCAVLIGGKMRKEGHGDWVLVADADMFRVMAGDRLRENER